MAFGHAPSLDTLLRETNRGSAIKARLGELDPEAAWILLLLATAGTPLTAAELSSGTRARDKLDDHVWTLERKGLIQRAGGSWEVAHDEIADAARDGEAEDRRRSAHVAVGRILMGSAALRVDIAIQACRHFADSGNREELVSAFRRLARVARAADPGRKHHELAEASVSGTMSSLTAGQLTATLPWRLRFGLDRPMVPVVAILVLVALIARIVSDIGGQPSEQGARLLLVRGSATDSSTTETATVRVDRSRWQPGTPLRLGAWTRIKDPLLARTSGLSAARDGRWAFPGFVDNARTDDIYLRDGDSTFLLTGGPRDDVWPIWSPLGDELYFLTARWSKPGADDYDIAAIEPRSGTVRPLTTTPDFDQAVFPAPHGALLAFARAYRDLRVREACWMTVDGAVVYCTESSIGEVVTVLGWLDARRVALRVVMEPTERFVEWDIISNEFKLFGAATGSFERLSPDGRWMVCFCQSDPDDRARWMVFPAGEPSALRPVEGPDSLRFVVWMPEPAPPPPLSIRVDQPALDLPVGQTYSPTAEVRAGGLEKVLFPRGVLRWSVRDTAVASVDPATGTITGRSQGKTTIVVALANGVSDSAVVAVKDLASGLAFRESWERIDSTRWTAFGAPFPRVVRGARGARAFNNNGDGSYSSGVVSVQLFEAKEGFGGRAMVSLPVTRSQWQRQQVGWMPERAINMVGWDRRTGGWRIAPGTEKEECGLFYPSREGFSGTTLLGFRAASQTKRLPVDSTWRLGGWHQIELQVFPDGTCALRVDGVPAWRSETKIPLNQGYRLVLQGNSVGSDLLVGPLEVWRGVRTDLDWSPREK